jgi:hypothetical protein
MTIEIIPRNHCDFRTYLAKSARTQSGAFTEVQFPDYGTVLWSPDIRNGSTKHCDFSTYLAKRMRNQPGACAVVQFPDYGTVLWSPGRRNDSRKALLFQHLSYEESESSVWRMHRDAIS